MKASCFDGKDPKYTQNTWRRAKNGATVRVRVLRSHELLLGGLRITLEIPSDPSEYPKINTPETRNNIELVRDRYILMSWKWNKFSLHRHNPLVFLLSFLVRVRVDQQKRRKIVTEILKQIKFRV